ncbi:DUF6221 family protein [Streptomyces sp. enrichment culture]|uniref:DUF6221 family protein n=1 Tax=Streptomyces sp. enrichment culture TaxID=1795815 RepID=UPI003F571319
MDDLLKFLAARIDEDRHHVASSHGSAALLGVHLRMLDSIERLAEEYRGLADPWDGRTHGLTYALRVLALVYAEHPAYREQEWHP